MSNNIKKDKCIFFAINDNYSFAVANVLMSLKEHSPELMEKCDIVIYHNGVSELNQNLLKKVNKNVLFRDIKFPESYDKILEHKLVKKWGIFVVCKFFGFKLIKEYNKVLHLDADMMVKGDISELFDVEEAIAWRKAIAWDPCENFKSLLRNKGDYISAPNGGLLYFNSTLNSFNITDEDIVTAFQNIRNLKRGGIDERIIAFVTYYKNITIKELEIGYNAPARLYKPYNKEINNLKILHFLDFRGVSTKPWKNLAAYLYFKDWVIYYNYWINLGGSGPIDYCLDDYYKLFAFDQAKEISTYKDRLKKIGLATSYTDNEMILFIAREVYKKFKRKLLGK